MITPLNAGRAARQAVCAMSFTLGVLNAAQGQNAPEPSTSQPPCCRLIDDVAKAALPIGSAEWAINEQSPSMDFGAGVQPYLAIELPPYTKPYSFTIQNIPQAAGEFGSTGQSRVLMNIETLDEDLKIQRRYDHTKVKTRGMGQEKTIFINPKDQNERYVIVYGTNTNEAQDFTISKQDIIFVGTGLFLGGADDKISISSNLQGVFKVESNGLAPSDK